MRYFLLPHLNGIERLPSTAALERHLRIAVYCRADSMRVNIRCIFLRLPFEST
jgi:hypothetical protein